MDTPIFSDPRLCEAFWTASPIPQAIVGRDGVFQLVNDAWSDLLGYSGAELRGKHFREITHPADLPGDASEVARLVADSDTDGYSMVKRYISKRGASVWVELHVHAVRKPDRSLDFFAVCVVPLPEGIVTQSAVEFGVLRRVAGGCMDLVKERPRECLIAFVVGLVAVGRLPAEPLIETVKSFFLPAK